MSLLTEKRRLEKFTKNNFKKAIAKLDNANMFASKRYRYIVVFTVTITGQAGNVY